MIEVIMYIFLGVFFIAASPILLFICIPQIKENFCNQAYLWAYFYILMLIYGIFVFIAGVSMIVQAVIN